MRMRSPFTVEWTRLVSIREVVFHANASAVCHKEQRQHFWHNPWTSGRLFIVRGRNVPTGLCYAINSLSGLKVCWKCCFLLPLS